MLQAIREKTSGWIAWTVIGVIIVVMALFGIQGYFVASVDTYVAKVGDAEIGPNEFRERLDRQRAQMRSLMGQGFRAEYFERPEIKRQILEGMIQEEALYQAAAQSGLVVPATVIREEIKSIPAFQVDGRFNQDAYVSMLGQQQMVPEQFQGLVTRDVTVRTIGQTLAETALVTDAEIDAHVKLRDQTRSFSYVTLPAPDEATLGDISDADVNTYFEAHKDDFLSEETVSIEYLELNAANVEVPDEPTDETLRERFEEQKARFFSPEQRLASHILITPEGDDAEAQKAALDKATALAAEAREGKDFAELAKASSQDPGSAANGGDLGWLDRGLTRPEFDEALFALEAGKISDPIRTEDGYHVIYLREVKPEAAKTFEEVRADLVREFKASEGERIYLDKSGRLVDRAYEDRGSLKPAADELGLTIEKAGPFGRAGGVGIAGNPQVIEAAFSEAVLKNGDNSSMIQLGPNHIAVLRVTDHSPAVVQPLETVREAVLDAIKRERLEKAARENADSLFARLKAGETLEAVAAGNEVQTAEKTGRSAANHDSRIVAEVFKLARPAEGKQSTQLVELGGNQFALVSLSAVVDGDPGTLDAAARDALRTQIAGQRASVEGSLYADAVRAAAEIEIVESRIP